MRSVTLLHNPKAGEESHEGDELMGHLRAAGFDPTYLSTKELHRADALREPGDLVVVAGGDGTVRKAATRLAGRGVPLAVIPLGTANNIAKTLGAAGEPRQLIAALRNARRRRFDVWAAGGPWGEGLFIESLGFGLFTLIMSALDARKEKNPAQFERREDELGIALRTLRDALPRYAPLDLNITLDGRDLSGRYVLLEALNVKHVGPNLLLAPDADPGDGQLDLVSVEEGRIKELAGYLEHRMDGKQEAPRLPVFRGSHLRITCGGAAFHLDDKVFRVEEEGARQARHASARNHAAASPFTIDVRPAREPLEFLVTA